MVVRGGTLVLVDQQNNRLLFGAEDAKGLKISTSSSGAFDLLAVTNVGLFVSQQSEGKIYKLPSGANPQPEDFASAGTNLRISPQVKLMSIGPARALSTEFGSTVPESSTNTLRELAFREA